MSRVEQFAQRAGEVFHRAGLLQYCEPATPCRLRPLSLYPELKVLYTSGCNDSGGNLLMLPGTRYLQKPYAMENLAQILRELLDSPHLP